MFEYQSSLPNPQRRLGSDLTGKTILLKFTGGVGDITIALVSTAKAIREKYGQSCEIFAGVMVHQIEYLTNVFGDYFNKIVTVQQATSIRMLKEVDCYIDFSGVFSNTYQLKSGNYYSLVSKYLDGVLDITPPWIQRQTVQDSADYVFLHPGASNPNRRWPEHKWYQLAESLVASGEKVVFLGTADEPGFAKYTNDDSIYGRSIYKLSYTSDALLFQILELSKYAKLFIGNDSGFCHLAGLMNIPGYVIFSATSPEDVISDYPTLSSISTQYKIPGAPTRSLKKDDVISLRCLDLLTVNDICNVLKIKTVEFVDVNIIKPNLYVVVDNTSHDLLADHLEQWYTVSKCNRLHFGRPLLDLTTGILHIDENHCRVDCTDVEYIKRALRELLC